MSSDEKPVAHPVSYRGQGKYAKSFEGTECGVMFEDDGQTGYFYATNDTFDRVFDVLHLYNKGDPNQPKKNDQVFIVWNPRLQKAGIFYHNQFHAVVDFKNKLSCCRTGFPPSLAKESGTWSTPHEWNSAMTEGLQP